MVNNRFYPAYSPVSFQLEEREPSLILVRIDDMPISATLPELGLVMANLASLDPLDWYVWLL